MKTSPAMSTLPSSGDHHGLRTTKLDVSVSLKLAQSIIALGKLAPETNSGEVLATVSSMAAPKLSIGPTIAPLHRRVNVLKLGPNPNRFEAMFREAEDFDELRVNMRHPETRKRLMEASRGAVSFNQGAPGKKGAGVSPRRLESQRKYEARKKAWMNRVKMAEIQGMSSGVEQEESMEVDLPEVAQKPEAVETLDMAEMTGKFEQVHLGKRRRSSRSPSIAPPSKRW
jgi:hypothetical protein